MVEGPQVVFLTEVRNSAGTLQQTIDSVRVQRLQSWAYVLMDDASTDATPAVIRRAAAADGRIRPMLARQHDMEGNFNRALDAAVSTGATWLAIVDGDDWLEPDFASTLLALAETGGADLAMARYTVYHADGTPDEASVMLGFGGDLLCTMQDFCTHFEQCAMFPTAWQWWGKIYRVETLQKLALRAGPAWDAGFAAQYYTGCGRVAFCEAPLLHYRLSPGSDSHRTLHSYNAPRELAAQQTLHTLRHGLLRQHHTRAPSSWQMAAYLDVREASARARRLLSSAIAAEQQADYMLETLGQPFVLEGWQQLQKACVHQGELFGMGAQRSDEVLSGLASVFLSALLAIHRQGAAAQAGELWAAWLAALLPSPLQGRPAQAWLAADTGVLQAALQSLTPE